jgi:Probable Zinc-ribbon domain
LEALAASHPDIAAQWHPERNGTKTPADFTYGSHFEAWWQCPKRKSHVWRARIASRTSMVAGCPHCARTAGKGGRIRQDALDAARSA